MRKTTVKKIVKESYGKIARTGCDCTCGCNGMDKERVAKSLGYSAEEIAIVPDANLGLGCGNPTALGELRKGMTVLDLGSGAGFDCFLAAKKVGASGRVIGVDMTSAMIKKARTIAKKYNYTNVEFRLGEIEHLPLDDAAVDVIISNCVINLSPDKMQVFREAYRVLRKGGRLFVSDIVLLEKLSNNDREDKRLIAGCVGGAMLKEDYLHLMKNAGFAVKNISEDRGISKRQYAGFPLESLKVVAVKK